MTEIEKYFVMDVEGAVESLSEMGFTENTTNPDAANWDAETLETYEIIVHGMKSALTNVNENELREDAYALERAAQNKQFDVIISETPNLIKSLIFVADKLKANG